MSEDASLTSDKVDSLRAEHYNARVLGMRPVHDDLAILRVIPDEEFPGYHPGQYTTLGLGDWEPRCDGLAPKAGAQGKLIRRAYSISCSLVDNEGTPTTCARSPWLEFYIALVERPSDDPPMLTPRLFALKKGDRVHVGPRPRGAYTLDPVQLGDDVILLSTGTGEAPHNTMIAELLSRGHAGRIFNCVCVRLKKDLGYLEAHRSLEEHFAEYRYFPLTTREPENLNSSHPEYVGKQYLQEFFASGAFDTAIDGTVDPNRAHVFLCGNPAMIGIPRRDEDGEFHFPAPVGMIEVLVERGFKLDRPRSPGNIHFEKYW
jgi:ferredoxin--NADP+ reductase